MILVFKTLLTLGTGSSNKLIEFIIRPHRGFCLSDHAPAFAIAMSKGPFFRPSIYRMNHPVLCQKLLEQWKGILDEVI